MQHVSGEEYRRAHSRSTKQSQRSLGAIIGIVVVLLALGGGLYAVIDYQKNQHQPEQSSGTNPPTGSADNSGNGISNGTGAGSSDPNQRSTGGRSFKATVTAVSSQSVTVKLQDGTTKTYTITANTTISNAATQSFGSADSGQATTSNIKVGDPVLVTPDPANTTQAIGILINPV